jgi:hypothetical protein
MLIKISNLKIIVIFYIFISLFFIGCAGHSLVEQSIISGLPEKYRNHSGGFILLPNKSDIDEAIALGRNSKDNNSLTYAYIIKGPYDLMTNSDIYVQISTPLYLISEHAREQAREYKEIETPFTEYCKNLNAVKISLTQQYSKDFRAYPFKRQAILLRDGKRIEPLSEIKSYKGLNPFASQSNKDIQNIMTKYQKMIPSQSVAMTPEQLEDLKETYRSMGYTEAQIRTYINAAKTATQTIKSFNENGAATNIVLLESDGIYDASDLKKQGKYEIVFRTPATSNMIVSGDKEIRFPISFDKFR